MTSGYYRFEFTVTDQAANTTSLVRWLKIDTTPLAVLVSGTGLVAIQAEALEVGSSRVTFRVADGESGIATQTTRYGFAVDAWPTASATSFSSGQTFSTTGYYRFEISAVDATGNTTTVVRWLHMVKPSLVRFYLPLTMR
jgi:hypothetical protein